MRFRLIAGMLVGSTALAAQSLPRPTPAFEVASIKVNNSGSENFGFTARPGGVMVATNVSVRQIVTYAYSMQNSRVEGGQTGWTRCATTSPPKRRRPRCPIRWC
jgi:hypothetical protein